MTSALPTGLTMLFAIARLTTLKAAAATTPPPPPADAKFTTATAAYGPRHDETKVVQDTYSYRLYATSGYAP